MLIGATAGTAREAVSAAIHGEAFIGPLAATALLIGASCVLYAALRRTRSDAGLGRILASPTMTATMAAVAMLALYLPRLILRREALEDLLVAAGTASVIAALAGGALSRFLRRSVPEDPGELT